MNRVLKYFDPLANRYPDIHVRLFIYISAVVVIWVFNYVLIGLLMGLGAASILALLAGDIFIAVIAVLSVRFKKTYLGGACITVFLNFVLFPVNFYISGGPFGGTLVWFVASLLFIDIALTDRTQTIFFLMSLVVCLTCCYISLFRQDLLPERSLRYITQTSTIAMFLTGSLINTIVLFGVNAYTKENQRAMDQAEEITNLNEAQSRFFSSMSHEIRTPINTIIGLNEVILRETDSTEILENSENIQAASKMLLRTINDLLDMAKFESGQMELTPAAYRTGDMLSEVVGMLWIRAKEKGLEFRVDAAPDLPAELYGDEIRIRQILVNVVNNAIKYTSEGSVTLQVQCERLEDDKVKLVYSVSDTGIGIKKESLPYLFTAFRRVDEEKNRYIEGTGLGLSIVKNLLDLMGGTISVNSIYTKGSTFIIEIPQTVVSDELLGTFQPGQHRSTGARKVYRQSFEAPQARVLVVDDTVANLMVIKKLLRDTKVQITTAGSGAEALEKTQDTAFHVIFMDHMMPEMDGIECLHRIRTQSGGLCKDSKIIALTANAGSDMKAMYAREGFDGYLVKPVNGSDLERELQYALPKELLHVLGNSDNTIAEESVAWISDHQKKLPVAITTESVADLPASLLKRLDITVIPHLVSTPAGIFRDGVEVDMRGVLSYMENGGTVRVHEPSTADYEAFFANALQHANNIIHIAITSKVSHSAYFTATEAAKAFGNISVVDSGQLSCGHGLLTLEAHRLAEEEKSVEEILSALEDIKKQISTSFIVDSADYLVSDDHISPTTAMIANAFMIHPVICMRNGKLTVKTICFGSRERAWRRYIQSTLSSPATIDNRTLFIAHAGLSHKELEQIRDMVSQKVSFETVYFQEASPSISANCGPGTFGLLFMRK